MADRIGKTQAAILDFIQRAGGHHVYVGAGANVFGTTLAGYTAEEVERSLKGLVKRNLLIEKKRAFYTLPGTEEPCYD